MTVWRTISYKSKTNKNVELIELQVFFFNFTEKIVVIINDGFHQLHDAANCQVVAWGAEPSVQVSVQVLSWGKFHVKKWRWNPWQTPKIGIRYVDVLKIWCEYIQYDPQVIDFNHVYTCANT